MEIVIVRYGKEPYEAKFTSTDFYLPPRTFEYTVDRFERYLLSGEVTCYQILLYELDDNGVMTLVKRADKQRLKKLPRTINKRNDKPNNSIKEEIKAIPSPATPLYASYSTFSAAAGLSQANFIYDDESTF